MTAGLPGLGLGGIFFIISALIAPFIELVRTARGRSSARAWRQVMRQFAMAVVMIFAIDFTLRMLFLLAPLVGLGTGREADELTVLPLLPIAITMVLLASLLAVAKGAQLVLQVRSAGLPRLPRARALPLPSRAKLLGGGATLVAAWIATLAVGAAELSPLSAGEPGSDRAVSEREDGGARDGEAGGGPLALKAVPPSGGLVAQGGTSIPVESAGSDEQLGPASTAPADASESNGGSSGTGGPQPGGAEPEGAAPGGDAPSADPPSADSPNTDAPDAATPEAPTEPVSPPATDSPATSGPPADAGPPDHSNAPGTAGPPVGGTPTA